MIKNNVFLWNPKTIKEFFENKNDIKFNFDIDALEYVYTGETVSILWCECINFHQSDADSKLQKSEIVQCLLESSITASPSQWKIIKDLNYMCELCKKIAKCYECVPMDVSVCLNCYKNLKKTSKLSVRDTAFNNSNCNPSKYSSIIPTQGGRDSQYITNKNICISKNNYVTVDVTVDIMCTIMSRSSMYFFYRRTLSINDFNYSSLLLPSVDARGAMRHSSLLQISKNFNVYYSCIRCARLYSKSEDKCNFCIDFSLKMLIDSNWEKNFLISYIVDLLPELKSVLSLNFINII
jgi:hypothetical protein